MCKIITLTNVSKVKAIKKLVNTACALVSESERDGFGYALQTTRGVFGERTLKPNEFTYSAHRPEFSYDFAIPHWERFGEVAKATGAALFHGRTSTNSVSLINTHPIQKHDWTLIHNGVVSNHGPEYPMKTSNDTEHLVEYLATQGISGIESHLTGYYAVAALDPNGVLHVIRDSTASLYVARIETIDSLIFATRSDHIDQLCETMKWTSSVPAKVKDNTYLTFRRGAIESHVSIKPRGRTSVESAWSSKSLGYKIDAEYEAYPPLESVSSTRQSYEESLDESETLFLKEIEEHGDSSYTIIDYCQRPLSIDEWRSLDTEEKLACTVVRPDGTIVCPVDYYAERLYGA